MHDFLTSKWLSRHQATIKNTDYVISKDHKSQLEMARQIFEKLKNKDKKVDLSIVLPYINDFVPLTSFELTIFLA